MRFFLLSLFAFFISVDAAAPADNPIAQEIETGQKKSYWKYHHAASIGYRRDRQDFHNSDTKTTYTDRNSVQINLTSHLQWYQIVGYFRGSYGWLASGNMNFSTAEPSFGAPLHFDHNSLGAGYSADARGSVGIKFDLLNGEDFGVSLVPSGGYAYSHLMNFAKGQNRFSLNPPSSGFAIAHFPDPNQQDWFGPYVDGRIEFLFWQSCEWSIFYQCYWQTVRSKGVQDIDLYLTDPPSTLTAVDLFTTNGIYKASWIQKQLVGTDFRYLLSSGWNFGLHFEASKAKAKDARYVSKTKREQYILDPIGVTTTTTNTKASILWVFYEVDISFGYQF